MEDIFRIFREFQNYPSPSGKEFLFQKYLANFLDQSFKNIYKDDLDNLFAFKSDRQDAKTIMITAHCDEVGFIICDILNDGFIKILPIGSINTSILPGTHLRLFSDLYAINGFVVAIPPHIQKHWGRELSNNMGILVDVGYLNSKGTTQNCRIGDYLTYTTFYSENASELVIANSIDNKVSLAILAYLFKEIKSLNIDYNLVLVSTTQEEIGNLGMSKALNLIKPDISIVLDVVLANDYPPVCDLPIPDIRLGDGLVISRLFGCSSQLESFAIEFSNSNQIKYQTEVLPYVSPTDGIISYSLGIPTMVLGIPCRYNHSFIETASKQDIFELYKLLDLLIQKLSNNLITQLLNT